MTTDLVPVDLDAIARRVEAGAHLTIQGIMLAGQALAEARQVLVGDREFGQWREQRLPWLSADTARNYRNCWDRFGSGCHGIIPQDIVPTVLYELARPSTDDRVVEAVITEAQAGKAPSVADVKALNAKHKEALQAQQKRADLKLKAAVAAAEGTAEAKANETIITLRAELDAATRGEREALGRVEQLTAEVAAKAAALPAADAAALREELAEWQEVAEDRKAMAAALSAKLAARSATVDPRDAPAAMAEVQAFCRSVQGVVHAYPTVPRLLASEDERFVAMSDELLGTAAYLRQLADTMEAAAGGPVPELVPRGLVGDGTTDEYTREGRSGTARKATSAGSGSEGLASPSDGVQPAAPPATREDGAARGAPEGMLVEPVAAAPAANMPPRMTPADEDRALDAIPAGFDRRRLTPKTPE